MVRMLLFLLDALSTLVTMSMRNLTLIIILLAIVAFSVAGYFLISKFSPQYTTTISQTPPVALSPTPSTGSAASAKPTTAQTVLCQKNQLSANISAQGAAGS